MTAYSRRRRPGVTLMEVLIATFILAIGLIAIMALFPIGAVNMARAINQDRSATHGMNSDAIVRYYWKQAWNDPNGGTVWPNAHAAYDYSQEPMLVYLESHPRWGIIPGAASQPGFPLLIDPVGHLTKTGNDQLFVAGNINLPMRTTLRRCVDLPAPSLNPPLIPGYSTSNVSGLGYDPGWRPQWMGVIAPGPAPPIAFPSIIQAVIRLTTLPDDMTFARPGDGSVNAISGEPADFTGQIDRGGRYNTAWLLHRTRHDVPREVNVDVLVYAGRSPTDTASAEVPFNAVTQPRQKNILIGLAANQPAPALRRGGWIGFSHLVQANNPTPTVQGVPPTPLATPYPTLDFYRIAGLNTDNPNFVIVELEEEIKVAGPTDQAGNYTGVALVFENLVEVFNRGTVTATGAIGR